VNDAYEGRGERLYKKMGDEGDRPGNSIKKEVGRCHDFESFVYIT
jgi:hypothetical protein